MSEERVDPYSEESLWDRIKENKVQIRLDINDKGEISAPPSTGRYLTVVAISDTHSLLEDMIGRNLIPPGDILLHAGDFTNNGEREELEKFNRQMGSLPHKHKIVIAGNHELGFDDAEDLSKRASYNENALGTPHGYDILTNVTYLNDRSVEIEGVRIYGSSWHPLQGYPFSKQRRELAEKWKKIPTDTDILLTHSPALGYLDQFGEERWGCAALLRELEDRVRPSFHVFGHVHEQYGAMSNNATTFINAASCNKSIKPAPMQITNRPIVFYVSIS